MLVHSPRLRSLCFDRFATPLFTDLFPSFLRFLLEVLNDILLVCASVAFDHRGHVLSAHIEHALHFLGRKQLVEASQLQVFFLVGEPFLEANQMQVGIDEPIEVKPNRVYCIRLENLNHSLQLKGGR